MGDSPWGRKESDVIELLTSYICSQNSLKLNCEAGPKMTPPTASTGHRHCSLSRAGHQTLMSEQLLPLLRYEHCFYYSQNGSCAVFPFTSFSTKFGTCKGWGSTYLVLSLIRSGRGAQLCKHEVPQT